MYILKITYSSRQQIKESSLFKKKIKICRKTRGTENSHLGVHYNLYCHKDFFKYYFFITIDIIRDLTS